MRNLHYNVGQCFPKQVSTKMIFKVFLKHSLLKKLGIHCFLYPNSWIVIMHILKTLEPYDKEISTALFNSSRSYFMTRELFFILGNCY